MVPAQSAIGLTSATTSSSEIMRPAVLELLETKRMQSSMAFTG